MLSVRSVGHVQLSPDRSRVTYTLTKPDPAANTRQTRIHIANTDGTEARFLTNDHQATRPRWSPCGNWIAFTSSQSGQNNLYLIRPNGDETLQLTDIPTGIVDFKWSPDAGQIAFVSSDPPPPKKDPCVVGAFTQMNRLWVTSINTPSPKVLTPNHLHVNNCFGVTALDWSPDGHTIAFSHTPTPHVNDWSRGDISTVDVTTGSITKWIHTPACERSPLYSPDGHWIAYQASEDPPSWASTFDVWIAPAKGGDPRKLASTHERWSDLVGWSSDSQTVYFTNTQGLFTGLFAVPLRGGSVKQVDSGKAVLSNVRLNPSHTSVGFISQTSTDPPEAHIAPLDLFTPVQISNANTHMPLPSGHTEVIQYTAPDGLDIEALITCPVENPPQTGYPLLLLVHGGPMGNFTHIFEGALTTDDPYPFSTFIDRGYAILRCNVRGSSGYGKAFLHANHNDWGGGDYKDLMAGIDTVIEAGIADPDRLGIMGWSYGGYLTAWTLTQTPRFKATSVAAGPANLVSNVGTTSIPTCTTDYLGEPWENSDRYHARSPISHIQNITTPTLIQSFESDDIVPASQGHEFYRALQKRQIPTEHVIYPHTGHGLREPGLQLDFARRNLAWFDRHLNP